MKRKIIPLFKVFVSKEAIYPLRKTLYSGYIGQGNEVELFESELAKFLNNPFCLTVNSGTSALWLALRLCNVSWKDQVVSTPMTCTATNWPILGNGANIKWADIDNKIGNVTPETIKQACTSKTKAIMVVDWGGYPCDIEGIKKTVPNIPIIEDAAHAFGAEYNGKKVGNSADFTCFSFQAIKHLTSVDGGLLTVRNKDVYDRAKLLRWYGIDRYTRSQHDRIEIDIKEWGYKFHMNDVNAVIGRANLKEVPKILEKHRDNAMFYRKNLPEQVLPSTNPNYLSSYWLFTIHVPNVEKFITDMDHAGIMVSQVHRRNDTHPVVAKYSKNLPGVDQFTKTMVAIPVGWWVSHSEREYVVNNINDYLKKN